MQIKGEIKAWLHEFEEKEGRPAGNEDKVGERLGHSLLPALRGTNAVTCRLREIETCRSKWRSELGLGSPRPGQHDVSLPDRRSKDKDVENA